MKAEIFDKAGMIDTGYDLKAAKESGRCVDAFVAEGDEAGTEDDRAKAQRRPVGVFQDGARTGVNGSAGICSTLEDMANWLEHAPSAWSPGSEGNGNPLYAAIQAIGKPRSVMAPAEHKEISAVCYGTGMQSLTYRGQNIFQHGGVCFGINSNVVFVPELQMGMFVVANDKNFGRFWTNVLSRRILDQQLGLEPVDWAPRLLAGWDLNCANLVKKPKLPLNVTQPKQGWKAIAGHYHNPGYGTLSLRIARSTIPKGVNVPDHLVCEDDDNPFPTDNARPTYIAKVDRAWSSHLAFIHADGQQFDVKQCVSAYETGVVERPNNPDTIHPWAVVREDGKMGVVGIMNGGTSGEVWKRELWGIMGKEGEDIEEKAEVVFTKL